MTGAALPSPASTDAIATAQSTLGRPLPEDLVASLLRHDGAGKASQFTLPPGHAPMPVTEIPTTWRMLCDIVDGLGEPSNWFEGTLTPFASYGNGDSLVLDQRQGQSGRVGEHYHEEGVRFDGYPASLADLLEATATTLETGRPYRSFRPVVNDGALDWDPVP